MFALIESCPEQREGMGWTGKVVSLMAHAFIVSAAIAATKHVVTAAEPGIMIDTIVWSTPTPAPTTGAPSGGSTTSAVPVVAPLIAPIEIPHQILAADPVSTPYVPGTGTEFVPGPISFGNPAVVIGSLPVDARVVDEPPELMSHPALRYPEVLRQAGLDGRVMVETVLDSLGHPEAGSLRVVSSSHPLFDPAALEVVQGSRYRPGRMGGRAVRVRVQVPVTFEIRR